MSRTSFSFCSQGFHRRRFLLSPGIQWVAILVGLLLCTPIDGRGQNRSVQQLEREGEQSSGIEETAPYLSQLSATADDPLFATYAAPMRRSEYLVDEGYQFTFDEPRAPVRFATDHAGDWGVAFGREGEVQYRLDAMHERPVVTTSYSDLVRYRYEPFADVTVRTFFQVYSSQYAVQRLVVTNETSESQSIDVAAFVQRETPVSAVEVNQSVEGLTFQHRHPPDGWTERKEQVPHVTDRQNLLRMTDMAETGVYREVGAFLDDLSQGALSGVSADSAGVVALQRTLDLAPGASDTLRVIRGVADVNAGTDAFLKRSRTLLDHNMAAAQRHNELLYRSVPRLSFDNPDREMMYWGAFNLLRQCMMPPEGAARHNYYLYSREPTWGWGHAGQVFHESLSMLAYVFLDPASAMDSQRFYMDKQWADGYIQYRVGPYFDAYNYVRGDFTSSAPWFNYENWLLYQQTGDRQFLQESYASGQAFYRWWLNHRDQDGDGLAEWGGHAILESVRDAQVALWSDVGWPSNFESPDLNAMLVKEAESLARMAKALGDSTGHRQWSREARTRAESVRETLWDDETGFFYHADREDNDFTFEEANDLKRQEISGFIPLWAGVASEDQAQQLVEVMTDTSKFWRPHGVPSLAADDPFYDPQGYWNGPVWVEWQYLMVRGLLDYGYEAEAQELSDRVFDNVIQQLKTTNTFWEFYSPDEHWGGHHQTYIWTGIVARMIIDLRRAVSDQDGG